MIIENTAAKRPEQMHQIDALSSDREIGFQMTYDVDDVTQKQTESGWRTYFLRSRADITGDLIRDAQAAPDQQQGLGGWYVSITFTDQGGAIFERITGANI